MWFHNHFSKKRQQNKILTTCKGKTEQSNGVLKGEFAFGVEVMVVPRFVEGSKGGVAVEEGESGAHQVPPF